MEFKIATNKEGQKKAVVEADALLEYVWDLKQMYFGSDLVLNKLIEKCSEIIGGQDAEKPDKRD